MRAMKTTVERNSGTDDYPRSLAWMALSAVGFATMAAAVKVLSREGTAHSVLVFTRGFVNLVLVSLAIVALRIPFPSRARSSDWRLLLGRGFAGFVGVTCLFYGLRHLPLPVAIIINWSSPVFVILLSRLFLGERMTSAQGVSSGLALAGLVLVVGPQEPVSEVPTLFAVAVAVTGAISAAFAYVAVRAATARIAPEVIVWSLCIVTSALSAPWVLLEWSKVQSIEARHIGLLLGMGVAATVGQIAMTQGYRYSRAGVVSVLGMLNAPASMLAGWFWFGEGFSGFQWIGLALMSLGIARLAFR